MGQAGRKSIEPQTYRPFPMATRVKLRKFSLDAKREGDNLGLGRAPQEAFTSGVFHRHQGWPGNLRTCTRRQASSVNDHAGSTASVCAATPRA